MSIRPRRLRCIKKDAVASEFPLESALKNRMAMPSGIVQLSRKIRNDYGAFFAGAQGLRRKKSKNTAASGEKFYNGTTFAFIVRAKLYPARMGRAGRKAFQNMWRKP
jgi:hypothetical protein